jgi:RHS repeat-associated protein
MSYTFTGKERDTESNLDFFDARYYSSSVGRFMTPDWSASSNPDPIPYADLGNPQSFNLYSYTKNNPTSGTDPNGHCTLHKGTADEETHGLLWCLGHTLGIKKTVKEQAKAGLRNFCFHRRVRTGIDQRPSSIGNSPGKVLRKAAGKATGQRGPLKDCPSSQSGAFLGCNLRGDRPEQGYRPASRPRLAQKPHRCGVCNCLNSWSGVSKV